MLIINFLGLSNSATVIAAAHGILMIFFCFYLKNYRVSINDFRVQPAMETCQILNVPLCSANNECHILRLGCWLLTRDKFQLCFTLANINVFII
jgi:hypothetical protein